MDVKLSLIVIVVKDEQPLNALFPIDVTFDKSGKYARLEHPSNVLSFTTERFDVPLILNNDVQPLKAELPSSSTELDKVISVIDKQSKNALSPIFVTNLPPMYSGTTTEPDKPTPLVIVTSCPENEYSKNEAFVSSE